MSIATFKITNSSIENAVDIAPDLIVQYINNLAFMQFLSDMQRHPGEIWMFYMDCSDEYFNLIATGQL